MTSATAQNTGLFPLRQRTGTAAFHMSTKAVGMGLSDLEKLTAKEGVMLVAKMLWGSAKVMPCPHCGTIDSHYWRLKELRWKCAGCDKGFSVTSGTVLADRKLPLLTILKIAYLWSNSAAGKPSLQLRRDYNVSYPTMFCLAHKLREGLLRGHNEGIMCGVVEMDGMDVLGRGYKEKRNRVARKSVRGKPAIPEHLLKPEDDDELVGPPLPPKFGKAEKQHPDRRVMISMRQRSVSKGLGAAVTRVGIGITESANNVTTLARTYVSGESTIMSDEDTSYSQFHRLFASHRTVNHSKAYSGPDGVNNNQAESFNARVKRAIRGVYLSISNKYMKDYAAEQAWREDTRRLSTGNKLAHLLRVVLSVGLSNWWRGYTHGHHRMDELLVEGPRPAPPRGKKVGQPARPPR